ncbi:MAG: hypothetical protein ACTS7E_02295 [Arsenophonus sp. NC-CH8-MAG3]
MTRRGIEGYFICHCDPLTLGTLISVSPILYLVWLAEKITVMNDAMNANQQEDV